MSSVVRVVSGALLLGAVLASLPAVETSTPVAAAAAAAAPATVSGGWYLALGDSIPFGIAPTPPNVQAYPEVAGQTLNLSVQNASCPGDTTQHFISVNGQDLVCGLFRLFTPLHTWYLGAQLDYARFFLWFMGKSTQLVTIQIGVNNVTLMRLECWFNDSCIARQTPLVLAQVAADEDTILKSIRATGYTGKLIVVTYYSTQPNGSAVSAEALALNAALSRVAVANGASVLDAYALFNGGSPGGDACAAGLLARNTDGSCDAHPSARGHALLANAVVGLTRAPK